MTRLIIEVDDQTTKRLEEAAAATSTGIEDISGNWGHVTTKLV